MNLSERGGRGGNSVSTAPSGECPERHDLLQRLNRALDDLSAAVRESREHGLSESERTEAARSACAQVWTELREHQEKHRCWRLPE